MHRWGAELAKASLEQLLDDLWGGASSATKSGRMWWNGPLLALASEGSAARALYPQ